jgi:hypothetical protein
MLCCNDVIFTPSVVNMGQLIDIQKGHSFFETMKWKQQFP